MKISQTIQNILILLHVGGRYFVRGPATCIPREVNSVCIVQAAKLGDMVCTTPMFRAVKAHYPHARVTVMGDTLNKEVLMGNPDVDDYIVWHDDVSIMTDIFSSYSFDAACVTTPNAVALASLYFAEVPCIIVPRVENGWCPTETRLYKLLRHLALVSPHYMGQYAPREYLRLLEPLGINTEDTTKHLSYSKEAEKKVKMFLWDNRLLEKKFVIISPSAGNKIKRWPADRFARIAEYVVETHHLPVVVIGGKRDKEEVLDMMKEIQKPEQIINAAERFSIEELKAFIAQAALFVSVDTGPIYIAEAFGVPTVDIVGPMDEREQPPIGNKHKVVVPQRDMPQLHIMNPRIYNETEAIRQVDAISVGMVCTAIDSLLSS